MAENISGLLTYFHLKIQQWQRGGILSLKQAEWSNSSMSMQLEVYDGCQAEYCQL